MLLCKQKRFLFSCQNFRDMTIEARVKETKREKFVTIAYIAIVTNFSLSGHDSKSSKGGECKYCNQRHNTLLQLECTKTTSVTFTNTQIKTGISNQSINISKSTTQYIQNKQRPAYYLPHHDVLREKSMTTKFSSVHWNCTNIEQVVT